MVQYNPQFTPPTTNTSYPNGFNKVKNDAVGKDLYTKDIGKSIRLGLTGIPNGAELPPRDVTTARFAPTGNVGNDWRVKISVPELSTFRTSPLLEPLTQTNNSVVFPITPSIQVSHVANYNAFEPVHSNYPFPQYVNSRIEDISISGEFPVSNEEEARYWVAVTHFFRSVTKMLYGETSNKGAPPPLCKLNGYGDFVFNNVPVVVVSFATDLPNTVDYIRTPIWQNNNGIYEQRYSMVPTQSTITITVKPTYSRKKVETFSFDKFVNGDLIDKGFI